MPLAIGLAHGEGNETLRLFENLEMTSVVPPEANRKVEQDYDHDLNKLRNEVERLFWRLKGCRCIYTRFDKLDMMFPGFLNFVLIVEMIYDLA